MSDQTPRTPPPPPPGAPRPAGVDATVRAPVLAGNATPSAPPALPAPGSPPTAPGSGTPRPSTSPPGDRADSNRLWIQTKQKVHDIIVGELSPLLTRGADMDLAAEVRDRLDAAIITAGVSVTAAQKRRFMTEITADILGYGPLEPLLQDPTVSEVMVNGPDLIFVERNGVLEATQARFRDEAHLRGVIDRIVSAVGRRVDESSPMCDARLPDGSRVNVILPPLSLRGAALTIRKFPSDPLLIDDLVTIGSLTGQAASFLGACVAGKLNILVSGGTGSGKTTLLNAVSQFIPPSERIITIEDAAELQLNQEHVLPLESRPANVEGQGQVSIRDLVRNALRMRPDRIIVGEVRGPEALDMLQAMNTGHEGSLTSIHSNSTRDALSRLETMVLMSGFDLTLRAIRDQVASALDIIVQLDRLGSGRRVITSIAEVQGMEGDTVILQDLFTYRFADGGAESRSSAGELHTTGLRPKVLSKLQHAGVDLPPGLFFDAGDLLGKRGR